jgi:hypothetical protein
MQLFAASARSALRLRDGALVLAFSFFASLTPPSAPAQVVLNELLASNRTTNTDEDGDSSDWVEIYNAGAAPVDLRGWGLSDEARLLHRWVFPPLVLEPGSYVLVWCSGKDRILPPPELITRASSPVPFVPSFVTLDDPWSYLTGSPLDGPPPEGWNQLGFDDSAWPSGLPGFGFGDDDDRTVLPQGIGAVFLRRVFRFEDAEPPQSLVLEVDYDDGFVAYLNGVRIAAANFPEGEEPTFASVSTRAREARVGQRFDVSAQRGLLERGDNVLAMVLVNQPTTNPSAADLSLIPQLGTVPLSLHTSFQLAKDGENVFLSDPEGRVADFAAMPPQSEDHSFGRSPDGAGAFSHLLFPTPLGLNDGHASSERLAEEPAFNPEGGRHSAGTLVEISAHVPFPNFEIRYTLGGAAPSATSTLYSGPITVAQDTVIRAAGFLEGQRVTRALSRSFFIRPRSLALPVISVSMNPADFVVVHGNEGGRGRASEREGFLEVFDAGGAPAAAAGFGLRLHGGAGRSGGLTTKKAYKAYFRSEYGAARLRYPMIPDTEVEEFDKLVLRSNFNDAFRTGGAAAFIRDQVIRDLHKDMGALISHGAWYNLFVNMEYRGLYNVVERMDRVFFASHLPELGDEWDVIRTGDAVLDGTGVEWLDLRNDLRSGNLADDAVYDEAERRIDVENFTGYMLLNIWAQNHDWPHNNWYAARPRVPDGRWIFLSWDAEFGIGLIPGGFSTDTFSHVLSRADASLTTILTALLENRRYRAFFLAEVERHLNGALSPENVMAHIRQQRALIAPDVPEECALAGQTVAAWERNVQTLEVFAQNRNTVMRNFILNSSYFGQPRISSVSPRRVTLEAEEVEVSLRGARLHPDLQVFFAGLPASRQEFVSQAQIRAVLPADARLEGFPEIALVDPEQGRLVFTNLLEVLVVRPSVTEIQPAAGSEAGGDVVTILGDNFTAGVRVEFGSTPSPAVERLGGSRQVLRALTPPGTGTVEVRVVNVVPGDLPATTTLSYTFVPGQGPNPRFRRGDADADLSLNAADAVHILRHLFAGLAMPACAKAADADDSGRIELSDAVLVLDFLFRRGPELPQPFPDCGVDETTDSLGCADPPVCGL